jgi:hypothetical protein
MSGLFFSLPMGANPSRDQIVGQDELGRPVYGTATGDRYSIGETFRQPRETEAGSMARVRETIGNLVRGTVDSLVSGATAPARALRGEPMTYGDAFETAGMAQLGGAALPAPEGALRIFAGRNARTADMDALSRAESMAQSGAGRDDIWRDTGWFQGVDGQWRFEIDDSGSDLTDYARGAITDGRERSGQMPAMMEHGALEEAYGGRIGEVTLDRSPAHRGAYYPDTNAISARGPEPVGVHSTLLHETQHAIQGLEGFAQGASPGEMFVAHMDLGRRVDHHLDAHSLLREIERTGDWDTALRDFSELGAPISPEGVELARRFGSSDVAQQALDEMTAARQRLEPLRRPGQWQDDAGFGPYWRSAGEVEARNVQARAGFTPEQRRETPPWATADVPEADQLLIQNNMLQLSAPETPAQSVARLLREGRASEVTDDMMAAADPQEMAQLYEIGATGMAMPLDEASRMARAGEMGFDTGTPLYHGTAADFQAFNTTSPHTWDAGSGGPQSRATWLTEGIGEGNSYARNAPAASWSGSGDPTLLNTFIRPEGEAVVQGRYQAADAVRQGAPVVNVRQDLYSDLAGEPQHWRLVAEPNRIRSRFARFDPRLSHLANLNAANASPLTGLMGAQAGSDDDIQRLAAYLAEVGGL